MKKTAKDYLLELFTDEAGAFSSKRVIAVSCAISLIVMGFIACFRTVTITETLVTGIVTFGCVAMGSSSVDKFAKKKEGDVLISIEPSKEEPKPEE